MIDISAYEDGILGALRGDALLAAVVQTFLPWQGEIDRARSAGAVFKYPAILVVYTGGPMAPRGASTFRHEPRFQVTIQCRNLRSPAAARAASAASERGVYDIAPHVLRVLAGQTLGLDMSELVPELLEPVQTERLDIAEYVLVFSTRIDLAMTAEIADTTAAQLAEIRAAYAVPDSGDELVDIVTDTHPLEET